MSRIHTQARQILREGLHRLGESSKAVRFRSIQTFSSNRPITAAAESYRVLPRRAPVRYATTLQTSAAASQIPPLPTRPVINVTPPSLEEIRADGFNDEAELIPPDLAHIVVTPQAMQQLAVITAREPPEALAKGLALRIAVDSGGCHGYQDKLSITEERGVDDYVFQPQGINCIPIVVDLVSLQLLKGSTLHFATELIGSSFRIIDNPQAKDGGSCGCGVSWEAA